MTQLTANVQSSNAFYQQNPTFCVNSQYPGIDSFHIYQQPNYIVQEPLGKRPFPKEFDLEMNYAPRAKRRFDKISACLENFSISNETPTNLSLDSSSDDDDMEDSSPMSVNNNVEVEDVIKESSEPVISEPDDEPAGGKKIRLDETLQNYLKRVKEEPMFYLPRKEADIKGNELTIWKPTILISPRNDFNMVGRITEIDDKEEARINELLKNKFIENEGMFDEETTENYGIVELDNSEDNSSLNSDIGSSWSSPVPSPCSQIVEIGDETRDTFTPTSLTNGSVSDEELMEFD